MKYRRLYILNRTLHLLPIIWGVATIVFLLLHFIPGDPVDMMLGEQASSASRVALRHRLVLDQPLLTQYIQYGWNLLHADLGQSLHTLRPVKDLLLERIGPTIQLAIAAMLIANIIALPLGIIAATHSNRWQDSISIFFALVGNAIPNFWLGPLLILFFSIYLNWLPVSGNYQWSSIILPAFTLGTSMAAILTRMLRATLLNILPSDFIVTARSKGLSERKIIYVHALRNALLPVITLWGLQFGALLSGAIVTEKIFDWPGIGSLLIFSIQARDYPVVQGCILCISIMYIGVNFLTDISYQWIDPRVTYEK